MKQVLLYTLFAFALGSHAGPAGAKTGLETSWDKGLRFRSEDGSFSLKVGGRIMNDWAWFDQGDTHEAAFGNWQDGTEFRRTRLYVSGTVYDNVTFKAQYDWTGGKTALKDMYVGVEKVPGVGRIVVGRQYEPFGLETLTSSKYITFMERSITGAFVPERQSGILARRTFAGKRATAAAGLFRETDGGGAGAGDGSYAGTARVTVLPWYDGEQRLAHIGVAYSRRNPSDAVEYDSDPESHLGGTSVEISPISADAVSLFGIETAMVTGPFSLQGEAMLSALDDDATGDPEFFAYYAYGSFFVTGESRNYKTSAAVFDRVQPNRNFRGDGSGHGAVELAVRVAFLDLNSAPVLGGEMTDVTVGVNWYLNPNTRVMMNYVRSDVDNVGTANIVQTRFQIDF
ncbi:MAG: OprO/OprP family phosphate-selective porin [Candidatus Krumholzibacteriia bacterium]